MTSISHSIQFFPLSSTCCFAYSRKQKKKCMEKNERIPRIRLRSAKWCVAFWYETQQTNRVSRLVFHSAPRRSLAPSVVSCTINKLKITKNTPDFTDGVEQNRLDAQTRGKKWNERRNNNRQRIFDYTLKCHGQSKKEIIHIFLVLRFLYMHTAYRIWRYVSVFAWVYELQKTANIVYYIYSYVFCFPRLIMSHSMKRHTVCIQHGFFRSWCPCCHRLSWFNWNRSRSFFREGKFNRQKGSNCSHTHTHTHSLGAMPHMNTSYEMYIVRRTQKQLWKMAKVRWL